MTFPSSASAAGFSRSMFCAAGRCISADREALASLRVQGTLMSVGEGAGILAALVCRENCGAAAVNETLLSKEMKKRELVL